jgi:hypothetical protein
MCKKEMDGSWDESGVSWVDVLSGMETVDSVSRYAMVSLMDEDAMYVLPEEEDVCECG